MDEHHVRNRRSAKLSQCFFVFFTPALDEDVFSYPNLFCLSRFEVNETIGLLTLVAYRSKGTYGNVSLLLFAQSLEAQQGLDYNASETVRQ